MVDLIELDFEGKSVGLTASNLNKATIARFFKVHEQGLHLKVMKNDRSEHLWPSSNGKVLVPVGTKSAHVVAFPEEDQDLRDDDDFQATFDIRYVKNYIIIMLF